MSHSVEFVGGPFCGLVKPIDIPETSGARWLFPVEPLRPRLVWQNDHIVAEMDEVAYELRWTVSGPQFHHVGFGSP